MKHVSTLGVLSAALLFTVGNSAACDYPINDVRIPNGRIATHDQMVEAQKSVKAYVAQMEAYLDCIEPRTSPTSPDVEDAVSEREARINSARYDAAVEKMEKAADDFNEALRQYREDR